MHAFMCVAKASISCIFGNNVACDSDLGSIINNKLIMN